MPALRDLSYHYEQILGYMEKARSAAGRVGEAKKRAKEAGVDVGALMTAMKLTRMEPLELAVTLRQQAALMTDLGLPVQIQLFETKYGSIEQQAAAEGWAAGKAGRSPNMERWDAMTKAEQQIQPAMMRDVWFVSHGGYDEAHFAVMPEEIARRCILAGGPHGGTVLDPFGGAGTTGLVADRYHRDAILVEINPKYAAMAHDRIRLEAKMFANVTVAAQ